MTDQDVKLVNDTIEAEAENLLRIGVEIWNHPELCYEEFRAHSVLTSALENYGFDVTRGYIVPTAFKAEFSKGNGGATIAVLCEYDALPDLGHACGHNLIAEQGIATAIAIKKVLQSDDTLPGKVVVLGAPAEEGGGGKIRLIKGNAFQNVDAALMAHPSASHTAATSLICIVKVTVIYKGKAAHASAFPYAGLNALDAAVAAYVNIGLLRQQLKPTCRIHGIIKRGGTACNIIPDETELQFFIRSPTVKDLDELQNRVSSCFESAAQATGCTVELKFSEDCRYLNLISNEVMLSNFKEYSRLQGIQFRDDQKIYENLLASSDVGNVSQVVPTIQPTYKIGEYGPHTKEFRDQSNTPFSHQATRNVAKTLALTALKLMRCPQTLRLAKEAFQKDLLCQ